MAESTFYSEGCKLPYTAVAACAAGDIVCLPDGRAGQVVDAIAAGALGAVQVEGRIKLTKTVDIALLKGGDAYWDVSAAKVHFRPEAGSVDFFLGTVASDQLAADTEVYVVEHPELALETGVAEDEG